MDLNAEIARRRDELAQQRAADNARREAQHAATISADRELSEIAHKFILWARLSGKDPRSINVQERTPKGVIPYTLRGWVLHSEEEHDTGWGGHSISFVLLTDGSFHRIRSQRPELHEEHFSPDGVLNYIVDYILRSGSTVPWPD
jgi:hypothetical protein